MRICTGMWLVLLIGAGFALPVCGQFSSAYQVSGQSAQEALGSSMARVGDINGDNVPDFIAGAPFFANTLGVVGRAQVISGLDGSVLLTRTGAAAGDQFGHAVCGLGDTNNDGVPDFAVGARFADGLQGAAGAVSVFSGADGSLLHQLMGAMSNDQFGAAVGRAGDVNNDGFADILVGVPMSDNGLVNAGEVQVFSGLDASVLLQIPGPSADAQLGAAVDGIGDVDSDGFADFVAGAPFADAANVDVGRVFLYSGATGSVLASRQGEAAGDRFGASVANAGQVDRDGVRDFIVGSPGSDNGGLNAGRSAVFSGADASQLFNFVGDAVGLLLGTDVDGAGDVNRDGFGDLIVGAIGAATQGSLSGRALVYSGRDGSILEDVTGNGPGDFLGRAVCGVGDINGDGFFDIAAAAPGSDQPSANNGGIRVLTAPTTPYFVYEDVPGVTRLYLMWTPNGGDPNAAFGTMSCTRATPGGLGQFAVSLSPASFPVFGVPVLIANDATNLIDSGTFGFGFDGEIHVPNVSRVAPQLAGLFVFVQFFERMPFASSSNGVALLLTPF